MSRGEDALESFFRALFILLMLAGAAVLWVFWLILLFVYRQLRSQTELVDDGPSVGMLGATTWWADTYERWLFRLEDATWINFTSSPERLFAGALVLATVVGIPVAFVAGFLAVYVYGFQSILPVSIPVFVVIVLANAILAWDLSRPVGGLWTSSHRRDRRRRSQLADRGGFILGRRLDDE